jgi:membrane protein
MPFLDLSRSVASLLREAGQRWSTDRCDRRGAALSCYAIFSLFPLALLSVTTLGWVLGRDPGKRAAIVALFDTTGAPSLRALLDDTLASMQRHQTARGVGTVVGLATLLLGASGAFSELDDSINGIWRVPPAPWSGVGRYVLGLARGKAIAFLLVGAIALVLLVSLVASTVLAALGRAVGGVLPVAAFWQPVELGVSLVLSTLVLALLFRFLPRATVAWKDVFWGALVTAALFAVLKKLLAYYLVHVASYAAYGVVGAMLGVLTWIYATSLLLYFGAELTRVYAERFGSLAAPAPTR